MKTLLHNLYQKLTQSTIALGLNLVILSGLTLLGWFGWKTWAANQVPGFETFVRINDINAEPLQHAEDLEPGDRLHVYLMVENDDEDNPIDSLQYYAPFAHGGVLAWIQPEGQSNHGSNNQLTFDLDDNENLRYVHGSTKTATNENGDPEINNVPDNQYGESKVFSDSNNPDVGFHWQDLKSGQNSKGEDIQYTVKYELEVVEGNPAVFNAHEDDVPTFTVRKRGETEWRQSVDGLEPGDIVEFRMFVHNVPRGSLALNTKVGVTNWTNSETNALTLTGYVDADNADQVSSNITITDDEAFALDYIEGSTRFQGAPDLNGELDPNKVRPDGIVTPDGIILGDTGSIEGCWDFRVLAVFQAEVVQEEPSPSPSPSPSPTPEPEAPYCEDIKVKDNEKVKEGKKVQFVCYASGDYDTFKFQYRRDNDDSYKEFASGNSDTSPEIEVSEYFDVRCIPCEGDQCASMSNVNDECVNRYRFDEDEDAAFIIEKYDDQDGDGYRDDEEPGLDWEFEWDKDHSGDWHDYVTYADDDGRGGRVGDLEDGDVIRIREKMKDGWESTTGTEKTITLEENETKVVVFGNRREKPTSKKGDVPESLPKTGAPLQAGLQLATSLGAVGIGLKLLSAKLRT